MSFSQLLRNMIGGVVALAVSLSGLAVAQVGPAVETGHARTRLAAERVSVMPGETITVGLLQELEEHWHVYWVNPGDSGLPLTLDWQLPDGAVAGDIAYPLPKRIEFGGLVNFGHEGAPVFLVDITVPETATPGDALTLKVKADWLICEDVCVPESATLRLILPVAETPGAATPTYAEQIAAARAALPGAAPFEATYYAGAGGPVLKLDGAPAGALTFFPFAPSLIEPAGAVDEAIDGGTRFLSFTSGFAYAAAQPSALAGVLVDEGASPRRGYRINAPRLADDAAASLPTFAAAAADTGATPTSAALAAQAPLLLLPTLGLALLGGLILNVMPCVFPIVFLKASSFAAIPRGERGVARRHGFLYTIGVLMAFAALAGLLLLLRAGGEQLGWGFHLQSPKAVAGFAVVMFLVGLNLAGVFEVGTSVQGVGDGLASRGGDAGAFFTGLLAVAVAAPCIGPFLGGAVGAALQQPAWVGVLIFMTIGLGLALPYLLISLLPILARLLPKPGAWMETMKQLFSFAMFAAAAWLVWLLSAQGGSTAVLNIGVTFVAAAFAVWLYGRAQRGQSAGFARIFALAAFIGALVPIASITPQTAAASAAPRPLGEVETVAFSPETLAEFRNEGRAVFVDFTAIWCITCQANKNLVLKTDPITRLFVDRGVVYMVADWTNRDPVITAALEEQGRAGIPLYLYYAPGAEAPVLLPTVLTVDAVKDVVNVNARG